MVHWQRYVFWFASPARAQVLAQRVSGPLMWLAVLLLLPGLWLGFVSTPADGVQGEGYRIIYLHVPASWMAMFSYALMAAWHATGLIWRTKVSHLMAHALAPTGAVFALLSLVTGALWGQPMWGTWWVWDARLTSSLLLLFLYIGYLFLLHAYDSPTRADKGCALLCLLSVVNLPIIYFSVRWWNTLHQGATIRPEGASMAAPMLAGLLLMTLAAWAYTAGTAMRRFEQLLQAREAHTQWLGDLTNEENRVD
jgi:heme exporter protein C